MNTKKKKILQRNCGFSYYRYYAFLEEFKGKIIRKHQLFKLYKVVNNPNWVRFCDFDDNRIFRFDMKMLIKYGHCGYYKHADCIYVSDEED